MGCPERTNAGPIRAGVRLLTHPQGCPLKRPSPARWCSYAYCRSLHITSFRSPKPYPMAGAGASGPGSWGRASTAPLSRPLAEAGLAHQRRAVGVAERTGDDLAGGRAALVDEDDELDPGVRGGAPRC